MNDAAGVRADQDGAALRDVAADRDRWRAAAESLRGELWRQIDELRAESVQQHNQITQLSEALGALLEAIVDTTPSVQQGEPGVVAVAPAAEVVAGPAPLILAPYVPANEPLRPHLEPKPEAPEFVIDADDDRVGVLTELMAVADHSGPEVLASTATSHIQLRSRAGTLSRAG